MNFQIILKVFPGLKCFVYFEGRQAVIVTVPLAILKSILWEGKNLHNIFTSKSEPLVITFEELISYFFSNIVKSDIYDQNLKNIDFEYSCDDRFIIIPFLKSNFVRRRHSRTILRPFVGF